jgi:hypothetical protein
VTHTGYSGHANLSPVELIWGAPFGPVEDAIPLPAGEPGLSGRGALECIVRRALRRPPCLVSFSGGRDSSTVLAIAVHVARREHLPDPIPATNVFPTLPHADETEWQELVIRHLGLTEWVRIPLHDELDVLGSLAADVVKRHGVLTPFNTHFQVPMLRRASGGSLLTGIGGDEVFEPTERAILPRLARLHRVPSRRQIVAAGHALAPRRVRTRKIADFLASETLPWLRPPVQHTIACSIADWHSQEPIGYDCALRHWWWRSRQLRCNLTGKALLATDHDVQAVHPFADPLFLRAYGRGRGRAGPPGRTWALRELCRDLLPSAVIDRETWGSFNGAFWTDVARARAGEWSGDGVDDAAVDGEALRSEWAKEEPDWHSFSLAQHLVFGRPA